MIIISAILFDIGIQMFVQVARTFPSGLSAITIVPSYLDDGLIPYIPLFYLLANIPLIIIFWNKIKKSFIIKTLFFLSVQASFGTLFFNETISNEFRSLIVEPDEVLNNKWPIFVLAAFGAVVVGFATSISWKFGGSSGGGDIIVYYFSTKKKINVGSLTFMVSLVFLMISLSFTIIFNESIRSNIVIILIGTLIYITISSLIINTAYPKYSKIKVEIHSENSNYISDFFKESNYIHAWHIQRIRGGYSNKEKEIISTTMLLLEFRSFKKTILEIDPNAWMSVTKVRNVIGNFNTLNVDENKIL
ncbi:MAG: YitT family protein [Mycoplasmatales bacterium]|nr:YitT family protein [Mycoplasmatales bacterium]